MGLGLSAPEWVMFFFLSFLESKPGPMALTQACEASEECGKREEAAVTAAHHPSGMPSRPKGVGTLQPPRKWVLGCYAPLKSCRGKGWLCSSPSFPGGFAHKTSATPWYLKEEKCHRHLLAQFMHPGNLLKRLRWLRESNKEPKQRRKWFGIRARGGVFHISQTRHEMYHPKDQSFLPFLKGTTVISSF